MRDITRAQRLADICFWISACAFLVACASPSVSWSVRGVIAAVTLSYLLIASEIYDR